jgi:hypothetical protein
MVFIALGRESEQRVALNVFSVFFDEREFPARCRTSRAFLRQAFLTVDQLPAFGATPHQLPQIRDSVVFEVVGNLDLGSEFQVCGHKHLPLHFFPATTLWRENSEGKIDQGKVGKRLTRMISRFHFGLARFLC